MVLASVLPPPPLPTKSGGSSAVAASQTTVQCLVSDLALYPLPANLRLESIDFENLILQHVKNNLHARSDGGSGVALASTTPAATVSVSDLTRDMLIDDVEDNSPKMVTGVEDTGAEMTSTAGKQQKPTDNNNGSSISTRHFVVSLEPDRLSWAALKSPPEGDVSQSAVCGFDYSQHCCHYMSTCLSEIKLCYVNIQLPNIIIWLLSSIPKKIVKRETPTAQTSSDRQHNKSELFALVLQCFREVDVVSMRQAYKQLRSIHKQTTQHKQLLTKKEMVEVDMKKASTTEVEMQKSNRSSSKEQEATKSGHHILSRQRVPARLIQENTTFHLKGGTAATSTRTSAAATTAASSIQLSQKKNSSSHQMPQQMRCNHIRSYLSSSTASESEFDTTQISTYLSQKSTQHSLMKSTQQNSSSSKSARTRSRSVESPRHRLRLLYKPIDDIEILIPSAYGRQAAEQLGFRRTLTKSRPSVGTTLKGGKQKSAKDSSYYTDSLNSEGSSLSDESTSGDYAANGNSNSSLEFDQHYFSQLASKLSHSEQLSPKSACGHPIVIKSALKKSSSYLEGSAAQSAVMANYRPGGYGGLFFRSSPATAAAAAASSTRERTKSESRKQGAGGKNARHCANSNCAAKKNVTFSAYATIQVVDN